MALEDLFRDTAYGTRQPYVTPTTSGTTQVRNALESIVGGNSSYIQNARRRGLESAATRGGVNSSIAAGNSERAALEAAQPLVQQGLQMDQANLQQTRDAEYNNWLSQQNFGRALYGQRFNSSLEMLGSLREAALADPELYTPEAISGLGNFFEMNMNDILKRYFNGR